MPEYMEQDMEQSIETTDIGHPERPDGCPAEGFQKINVCVPVTVTPFAHTGSTKIKCCGDPVVIPGDKCCSGKKNGICTFTISQTLCVEVPVKFGATAAVGDTFVDCLGASNHDICVYCDHMEAEEE